MRNLHIQVYGPQLEDCEDDDAPEEDQPEDFGDEAASTRRLHAAGHDGDLQKISQSVRSANGKCKRNGSIFGCENDLNLGDFGEFARDGMSGYLDGSVKRVNVRRLRSKVSDGFIMSSEIGKVSHHITSNTCKKFLNRQKAVQNACRDINRGKIFGKKDNEIQKKYL